NILLNKNNNLFEIKKQQNEINNYKDLLITFENDINLYKKDFKNKEIEYNKQINELNEKLKLNENLIKQQKEEINNLNEKLILNDKLINQQKEEINNLNNLILKDKLLNI